MAQKLLPQVTKQEFYKIYILDDGSTDESRKLYLQYPGIEVIYGAKSVGPTANRNRVLGHDLGDVIFFLDDDMRLEVTAIPQKLTNLFSKHPETAIIGAAVLRLNGEPLLFHHDRQSNPLFQWAERPFKGPNLPKQDFDVPYKKVAWVLEGAFAIRSKVFEELGGFDEHFRRYQEGPDLCKRAIDAGYDVGLSNQIKVTHSRELSMFSLRHYPKYLRSSLIWYWKHTIK